MRAPNTTTSERALAAKRSRRPRAVNPSSIFMVPTCMGTGCAWGTDERHRTWLIANNVGHLSRPQRQIKTCELGVLC